MTFLTMALLCAALLVFTTTRIYGAVGLGLLFLVYPYWSLSALLVLAITFSLYLWSTQ